MNTNKTHIIPLNTKCQISFQLKDKDNPSHNTSLLQSILFNPNKNKSASSFQSLLASSTSGRNKQAINLKQITPQGFLHKTVSMFTNLQSSMKGEEQRTAHANSSHRNKSSSLPKVVSRNTNQIFFRSTSRVIQEFNQKNHIINRKDADLLRKLYNEDQNFLDRLNRIKKNNQLALRRNFSSEWYQTLLINESAKNISSKGLKKMQINFNKINSIFNRKPHQLRVKVKIVAKKEMFFKEN